MHRRQLCVPPAFAPGFVVTGEVALFLHKCSDDYAPASEGPVLWNDPGIGIEWPIAEPSLSDKDRAASRLRDMPKDALPRYAAG